MPWPLRNWTSSVPIGSGRQVTVISESAAGSCSVRLNSLDWNFADSGTREAIHDIHPYPARFIPEIPRELIRLFHPGDDSAVFDPFCGCGTTLVEAVAVGLPALGVDLNPLAVLISKVKTTRLREPVEPLAQTIVAAAGRKPVTIPAIPRLDHWFQPNVQLALARIVHGIGVITDRDIQDALKVALSRIIVRVSNQDSDTRYAAVSKRVNEEDVYSLFCRSAADLDVAIASAYEGLFSVEPRASVIHDDVLEIRPEALHRRVGLVITSPPYPNAYEYWLYHKYRMYWLGMDPIALRKGEIGARPHYFKKDHQTEDDFRSQMSTVFRMIGKVLPVGKFACFVVGRSIIHGREIDNVELLKAAAQSADHFEFAGSVVRSIASNRKSFNLSHAAIKQETIVVFARVE